MRHMRTTVTLDPDVGARLKEMARERDVSFKEVLNLTLRVGLAAENPRGRPFVVHPKHLGRRPGVNLHRALQLSDQLEDEAIAYKLDLGK